MATIKTIKPAGGGDFTSLALWEEYAGAEATADQWAECYSGGNLGSVTLQTWSSTPDSNNYPKIYAATDNQHLASASSGAYISVGAGNYGIKDYLEYLRIEGIRIAGTSSSDILADFQNSGASRGCRVEKCLLHGTFVNGINIGQSSGSGGSASCYSTNNIVIIDGSLNVGAKGIQAFSTKSGGSTTIYIYNNTIYVADQSSYANYGVRHYNSSGATLTLTAINNIVIGSNTSTTSFSESSFTAGTKTFHNNISSDGTAADFGGLNNLTNRVASNIFTSAPTNDFSLNTSSIAINAGKTIEHIETDILGMPRPQSTGYDIGAIEKLAAPASYFEIPTDIIDLHEYYVDGLINGPIGQTCQLFYPMTNNSLCPNCIYSPRKKKSSGIYKSGGPIPFPKHSTCPWCGGSGKSSRAVTEDISLRVYWSPKDWISAIPVEKPDLSVMVIGHMSDLPKLEKSDKILLNKDVGAYRKWFCERSGEASPHGLAQDKYFSQMLRRVGG